MNVADRETLRFYFLTCHALELVGPKMLEVGRCTIVGIGRNQLLIPSHINKEIGTSSNVDYSNLLRK